MLMVPPLPEPAPFAVISPLTNNDPVATRVKLPPLPFPTPFALRPAVTFRSDGCGCCPACVGGIPACKVMLAPEPVNPSGTAVMACGLTVRLPPTETLTVPGLPAADSADPPLAVTERLLPACVSITRAEEAAVVEMVIVPPLPLPDPLAERDRLPARLSVVPEIWMVPPWNVPGPTALTEMAPPPTVTGPPAEADADRLAAAATAIPELPVEVSMFIVPPLPETAPALALIEPATPFVVALPMENWELPLQATDMLPPLPDAPPFAVRSPLTKTVPRLPDELPDTAVASAIVPPEPLPTPSACRAPLTASADCPVSSRDAPSPLVPNGPAVSDSGSIVSSRPAISVTSPPAPPVDLLMPPVPPVALTMN